MKIHILGSTGMLGCYILKYLQSKEYNVRAYTRHDIDAVLFDRDKFIKGILSQDVIINCIGLLKPKIKCNAEAVAVNSDFPLLLDGIASTTGCNLINFSSDCVFSGNRGNYIEADECDATDIYGITKKHQDIQSTVIRASFIGEELSNKQGLLEFALKHKSKSITGYTNCLWNGVTGLHIAKIIDKMLREDNICFWSGVRHVFSDRVVSKYEIINMLNDVYRLNLKLIPVKASEISNTSIKGTLDRSLFTAYNKIEVPSLEEMIYDQRNYIYEN